MGWRIIGEGRGGYDGHEEEMERELQRAYEEGFEEGRREARGGYGERRDYEGDGMDGYDGDGYGERRGVKGTGRYSRYRRR